MLCGVVHSNDSNV
jgi:hypothetical protein